MAIDIREIELTDEQKRRIAQIAEQTGQSWKEVLDQELTDSNDATGMEPYWAYKDRYIRDREKRIAYFREWVARRKSYNPNFVDSRDSIYPDRG
jgi:predicted transcriptional regulator